MTMKPFFSSLSGFWNTGDQPTFSTFFSLLLLFNITCSMFNISNVFEVCVVGDMLMLFRERFQLLSRKWLEWLTSIELEPVQGFNYLNLR